MAAEAGLTLKNGWINEILTDRGAALYQRAFLI